MINERATFLMHGACGLLIRHIAVGISMHYALPNMVRNAAFVILNRVGWLLPDNARCTIRLHTQSHVWILKGPTAILQRPGLATIFCDYRLVACTWGSEGSQCHCHFALGYLRRRGSAPWWLRQTSDGRRSGRYCGGGQDLLHNL